MRRFPANRGRAAFSLAETLVALAVAGSVLLPAVVLVQRLLTEDRRLDAQVADVLHNRPFPVSIPFEPPSRP